VQSGVAANTIATGTSQSPADDGHDPEQIIKRVVKGQYSSELNGIS